MQFVAGINKKRSGRGVSYCGSHAVDRVAWTARNSGDQEYQSSPGEFKTVERRTPKEFGLCDMSGNVGEWVADCRNGSHVGMPADGRVCT